MNNPRLKGYLTVIVATTRMRMTFGPMLTRKATARYLELAILMVVVWGGMVGQPSGRRRWERVRTKGFRTLLVLQDVLHYHYRTLVCLSLYPAIVSELMIYKPYSILAVALRGKWLYRRVIMCAWGGFLTDSRINTRMGRAKRAWERNQVR